MSSSSLRAQLADLLGEEAMSEEMGAAASELPRPPRRLPVAQALRQCPRPGLLAATDGAKLVAVAALPDGSTVVLPDLCPHDGGLISDGFIEGERIVCARHGWEFEARSGRCTHRADLRIPCEILAEGSAAVES